MPVVQKNRLQLEFKSLEDYIEQDNTVRFIDAFVEKLELSKLSFVNKPVKVEGRPSFSNALLEFQTKNGGVKICLLYKSTM